MSTKGNVLSNPLTILVTGATGKQGGAVARELLARGHNVRALARDPQSEPARTLATDGATVVAGDYEEPSAVESAGRGADAVFVVATPYEAGPEAETRQATNAIEALRRAEVGHIVYTSVASADQKTRIPHFDSKRMVEERLQQLDGDYTIVGPVYFMENLLAPWTLPQLREGRHAAALPAGRPLQQIAVADVALFSVIVLERGRDFAGKRIDIASDELTGAEVVKVLSETTGLPSSTPSYPSMASALRTRTSLAPLSGLTESATRPTSTACVPTTRRSAGTASPTGPASRIGRL